MTRLCKDDLLCRKLHSIARCKPWPSLDIHLRSLMLMTGSSGVIRLGSMFHLVAWDSICTLSVRVDN